jgi:hypothetical protein
MNHKITFIATALLLMSGSAFAQTTTTCPPGTVCPASHPVFVTGKGCRK